MATSSSFYRYLRLQELLGRNEKVSPANAASILRNQQGLLDKNIGIGNEKALNQLIAHHAIIFQPEKLRFWVTANPYQLGEFVCYDLSKVFSLAPSLKSEIELNEIDLTIPADSFLVTNNWENFLFWREVKKMIKKASHDKVKLEDENVVVDTFIQYNPELWETYQVLGNYFKSNNNKSNAKKYFDLALTKEINDTHEADKMREEIKEMK